MGRSHNGTLPASRILLSLVILLFGAGFALGSLWAFGRDHGREQVPASPTTFRSLLALSPTEIGQQDVALLNLLCAEGLTGAEDLQISRCLATLDKWSKDVDSATRRTLHRFRESPASYENSEAFFRALMLLSVLQSDFGIHYNPARIESVESSSPNDVFFADSRDVFLHGLLGDRRMGTCASLPVLYVAVGRRLGYPLKLVCAKAHVFVRWESADGKIRFNIEGVNHGMNSHPDEYYRTWPGPITEAEMKEGYYLKSLSPAEELAEFLVTRGACLESVKRFPEAQVAYAHAHYLSSNPTYRVPFAIALRHEIITRPASFPEGRAIADGLAAALRADNQPKGKLP
jgi:hypothetical protein